MNRDSKQVLTEYLVLSAQGGSESAFRDLHDLWRGDLRRMAVSRLGDADGVDDTLSDVWLAIARGLQRLDDPACFPRWAFRIVERRSVDWIRRRDVARRREAAVLNEADRLAPAGPPAAEAPDDVVRLREAIAALPSDQRQLVHLYYSAGCSVPEIAEALDLPAGTVKSRLFTVRETLRQMLERQHP